jgi:anti-sigma-K factor RskA
MVNCQDFQKRFDIFLDGEVDGRTMRDLALHVSHCTSCEEELRQSENLQKLIAGSIQAGVDRVDAVELWRSIEAGLEAPPPSLAVRLRERWEFRSRWELRTLAVAASALLAVVLAGTLWWAPAKPVATRLADNHAQIDRLDSSAPQVVVWSEPEQHTTAIWVASYEP